MDSFANSMLPSADVELNRAFLARGYLVAEAEDRAGLERLRDAVAGLAAAHLGLDVPGDIEAFLNSIHERVGIAELNDLRLAVINGINGEPWLRQTFYGLARGVLDSVVGNELVMQRRVNLSIQLPADDSSLLPVHADVWDGDSPFEVVVWLPLVDCYRTKGMFILPPAADGAHSRSLKDFAEKTTDDVLAAIRDDLEWPELPFGKVLVFSQTLMHGNQVNEEADSRWSMNCRFKSLFSPFADKPMGEFFEPITIRAATRFGMNYQLPDGFDE